MKKKSAWRQSCVRHALYRKNRSMYTSDAQNPVRAQDNGVSARSVVSYTKIRGDPSGHLAVNRDSTPKSWG